MRIRVIRTGTRNEIAQLRICVLAKSENLRTERLSSHEIFAFSELLFHDSHVLVHVILVKLEYTFCVHIQLARLSLS